MIPGYLHTTPNSHRTMKRRKLQRYNGRDNDILAKYGRNSSSTSTVSCFAAAPECAVLGAAAGQICLSKTSPRGCVSEQKILKKCKKEQRPKNTSTRNSHGSSRCTSTGHLLAAEETHLQGTGLTCFV